jgi:hypothetical protein
MDLSQAIAKGSHRRIAFNYFTELEARGVIPLGYAGWIIASLDPFHDRAYAANGPPTYAPVRQLTRVFTETVTVPCTSVVGNQAQVVIEFYPNLKSAEQSRADMTNGQLVPPVATKADYCGCVQWAVQEDGATPLWGDTTVDTARGFLSPPTPAHSGTTVVGCSMEVRNVSSALEQSGMCYAVQGSGLFTNQHTFDASQLTGVPLGSPNNTTTNTYRNVGLLSRPPITQSEITNVPGHYRGLAREGVMMIMRQNPAVAANESLANNKDVLLGVGEFTGDADSYVYLTPSSTYSGRSANCGLTTGSVLFTGLSKESTLELSVRWILCERLTIADSSDIPLSRPSPPVDSGAIEFLSALQRHLADAYPVSDNDSGRFWGGIVAGAKKVLPMLTPFMPEAAPFLPAIEAGLTYADKRLKERAAVNLAKKREKRTKEAANRSQRALTKALTATQRVRTRRGGTPNQ